MAWPFFLCVRFPIVVTCCLATAEGTCFVLPPGPAAGSPDDIRVACNMSSSGGYTAFEASCAAGDEGCDFNRAAPDFTSKVCTKLCNGC